MRYYTNDKEYELTTEIQDVLKKFRSQRNFIVKDYIKSKVDTLNSYMKEFNLDTCVVALSGGIDSAIVYAILKEAKKEESSPIKRIIPLTLPVFTSKGATNQEESRNRAKNLTDNYGDSLIEIQLDTPHAMLRKSVNNALGIKGEPWADGQLVSYLRTPTYYYVTSLLTQKGHKPIFCGTTNKDEGAYLGYFGKASDGMVDVQLISDIHKSEIYQVAEYLGVVESILKAIPTGDMYDNRSDEDVFGAPYEFVEIYLNYLNMDNEEKANLIKNFSDASKIQFEKLKKNLDDLHKYNKHKYLGCSPAVHLDVIESRIKGGWKYYVYGD